jgi:hypothetical protein
MTPRQLHAVRRWFGSFLRPYLAPPDSDRHALVQLKLTHSARVAVDCRDVAGDLGWPRGRQRLAYAAGLLHDAGRFPQFAAYGTFADQRSVDHGEAGAEAILREGAPLPPPACPHILDAVRYHNRRHIPDAIDAASLPLLQLVRDADKLDIMRVVRDAVRNGDVHRYPELLIGVDLDGPPSIALLDEIRGTRHGSYENVASLADMNLMRLTWIYDINYRPALARLQSRGLADDIVASLPDTPAVRAVIEEAMDFMRRGLAATP